MINIIEKALNKLGYYKSDMPEGSKASEADILEMFNTYGQTKVFKDLLHNLLDRDKDLHFHAASDADRDRIQGAYQRTNYFISLINKSNDRK